MNWGMDSNEAIFINGKGTYLSFNEMIEEILKLIAERPELEYVLSVGTDSQVKPKKELTKFVSVIHLHRKGRGAWCWKYIQIEKRGYHNLKEKIFTECHLTQILAYKFFEINIADKVLDITIDYLDDGAEFSFVPHVDIGTKGKTKAFVEDVTRMFDVMGCSVKIKPDSYTASGVADKYSKW